MAEKSYQPCLKWTLVVLAVLLIVLAIPVMIWAAKEGGIIPVMEIIGCAIGIVLAIFILIGIFVPSRKMLTFAFYTSFVLLGLKIVTFILTLLHYVLSSNKEKEQGGMTIGSVIIAAIMIGIHFLLPFMIRWYSATLDHDLPTFVETVSLQVT